MLNSDILNGPRIASKLIALAGKLDSLSNAYTKNGYILDIAAISSIDDIAIKTDAINTLNLSLPERRLLIIFKDE